MNRFVSDTEKLIGFNDFITNACNQDNTEVTKLSDLYKSYENFTKEILMKPYSRSSFKEHLNHLFKIKKDTTTNNLIVSGIKVKEKQQTQFKLKNKEVIDATLEEAKTDMLLSNTSLPIMDEQETTTTESSPTDIIVNITETTDLKETLSSLRKQRQMIDKKISVVDKLSNIKESTDKLFTSIIAKIDNVKDPKDVDELSKKINNIMDLIESIKI